MTSKTRKIGNLQYFQNYFFTSDCARIVIIKLAGKAKNLVNMSLLQVFKAIVVKKQKRKAKDQKIRSS